MDMDVQTTIVITIRIRIVIRNKIWGIFCYGLPIYMSSSYLLMICACFRICCLLRNWNLMSMPS